MNAEMPIVVLVGTAHERGLAHGTRFRSEIAAILNRDLHRLPTRELAEARKRAFVTLEAIRSAAPDVAEELVGIAEGAGCEVPDIVLRSGFELLKPIRDTGCSAIAAKTTSGAIAAQNWDGLPSKHGDLALFLHFSPSGFRFALVASIGGLGFAGMNDRGLALVNTDLILSNSHVGIPSQVIRRLIMEMPDVSSAIARMAALQHMGGRTYLLADRTGNIATVEISAESGPSVLPPADIQVHTNNALLSVTRLEEDVAKLQGVYPSSAFRLAAMQAAVVREGSSVDVDWVKRVLRDEMGAPDAVCKTASANEPTETAFSIVMDCHRGEMHIAAGKPSVNPYRKVVLPTE